MTEAEKKQYQEEYRRYVKMKTPVVNVWVDMVRAFFTGGVICMVGQWIFKIAQGYGFSAEVAGMWMAMILVFASTLLTGLNWYPSIAKWGGAGALVPITGFANAVAAPAIEYRKEGQVMGIGCKIFTIAGPVVLYGIVTSWILGLLYWLFRMLID